MKTEQPVGAGYFAAHAEASDELARLRLIEAELDPHTFRHLEAIGVGAGWRCLEVGAGAGSVVRWLSHRVGRAGRVVAADLDPRFIGNLREPNLEVRRCDITRDDIEPARYDLVHSRNLLMHLDDPADVLRRMAAALRPGGWLVAEEPDNDCVESVDPAHPLAEVFNACWRTLIEFLVTAGTVNMRFGKVLPGLMDSLDLIELGNEAVSRVYRGGDPWSRFWIQTWERFDDVVAAEGVLTESDVADMRRAFEDPTFAYRAYLVQSVWGRRPPSEAS
jgi:SAM-dependent methyltransferase